VSAEQLIALEAALAELSTLCTVAQGFTALESRAEHEWLPRVRALGSKLRGLLRADRLTEEEIGTTATEIMALGSQWRWELEQIRASALYQRALAAFAADRQEELALVIPQVLAGLHVVQPVPALYFPVSVSRGRRRQGVSPFLSAAECVERITRVLAEGITPEPAGTDWWERELPGITCADTPAALDTPIALRLDAPGAQVSVFAATDEPSLRIFTPRLHAPLTITLATEAGDEWWEAYEESYGTFRDALRKLLTERGHVVTPAAASGA
jgi:hypothetical protein